MLDRDRLLLHHQLPVPLQFATGLDFVSFLRLFNYHQDASVLSPEGHLAVAQAVRQLVASVVPLPLHHPVAGNWGSGDDCHVWYATGNYNLESTARRVNLPLPQQVQGERGEVTLLNSAGTHKHALEFDRRPGSSVLFPGGISSSIDSDANKVMVRNPFDHDRMLSLTYLTDSESMSYPRTRVILNGKPTVLLQPFHDDEAGSTRHMARTTGVGFIPANSTSTILLEPQQSTKLPFRLLGASLLAEEVQDLVSIEFALESDSLEAAATDDDAILLPERVTDQTTTTTKMAGYFSALLR